MNRGCLCNYKKREDLMYHRKNLCVLLILAGLLVVLGSCASADSDKSNSGPGTYGDTDSDGGVDSDGDGSCENDATRCQNESVERCISGIWSAWDDCAEQGKICSDEEGPAACVSPGGDSDGDTDSDVDTDSDSDSDTDSDGDADSDMDSDTDSDTDADSDMDTDTDADSDADSDCPTADTDYSCETNTCIFLNKATEEPGYTCPGANDVCCRSDPACPTGDPKFTCVLSSFDCNGTVDDSYSCETVGYQCCENLPDCPVADPEYSCEMSSMTCEGTIDASYFCDSLGDVCCFTQ